MSEAGPGVESRVLQVMPRSAGGSGHHVADVVRSLDGRDGLAIEVAAPRGVTVPMPKAVLAIEVPRGVRGRAASVARLRRMYRETGADVIHAHGLRAGVDAGIAARLERIPSAVTVHNLVRDEITGRGRALVVRRMEGVAVRLADVVFAPSRQIASHLMSAIPSAASRVEVAYLPPPRPRVERPAQDVRAELGAADSDRLVITVTRLVRQKALDVLLEALASLPPEFILAIVGEGYLAQELRERAVTFGVASRVRWLGWRDDVGDLIAAADAFALSSVWEAVGLAAQEAVQLGTPVVSTDVGG
ncbi:MAG TPA: glycosyltransferase, partial [Actinomycetota bacterium]|nr:glycosyltransferase [Actinomycetota bacterium]